MAAFHLSKAGPEDIAACVDVLFDTFNMDYFHETFSGPDTPKWRAHLTQTSIETLKTKPGNYWIKVTDTNMGKVIAASHWEIQMNTIPSMDRTLNVPWFDNDPEMQAVVATRLSQSVEVRKQYITEPFIQPRIFAVHPDFGQRGVGTMMMRWGCDLADHLFLPVWVQSTRAGMKLYTSFGCLPLPGETKNAGGMLLKREARTDVISGGKPVRGDGEGVAATEAKDPMSNQVPGL